MNLPINIIEELIKKISTNIVNDLLTPTLQKSHKEIIEKIEELENKTNSKFIDKLFFETKIEDLKLDIEELKLELKNLEEKIEKKNFYFKYITLLIIVNIIITIILYLK